MRLLTKMEGTRALSNEPLAENNWSVYEDAFAPSPPKALPKPWERAPVSATAPRLAGTKIFKRNRGRSLRRNDEKENEEFAQVELEKSGAGARKRPRVLGEKRSGNIADAAWKVASTSPQKKLMDVILSPQKGLLKGSPVKGRKRTNADHVITPRKSSKRVQLIDVVQSPIEEKPRRRKSLRKSARRSTITGLEVEQTEQPKTDIMVFTGCADIQQQVVESEMVSMAGEDVQPTIADVTPMFELSMANSPAQEQEETGLRTPAKSIQTRAAETIDWMRPSPALRFIQEDSYIDDESMSSNETPLVDEQLLEHIEDSEQQLLPEFEMEDIVEEVEVSSPQPHTVGQETEGEELQVQAEDILFEAQSPVHPSTNESRTEEQAEDQMLSEQESLALQPSQDAAFDKSQQVLDKETTILKSIEEDSQSDQPPPSKVPTTPKSRKRAPQRRGTRRSTRTGRASSVHSEGQSDQELLTHESLPNMSTRRSLRSSSPKKQDQRRISSAKLGAQAIQEMYTPEALLATPTRQSASSRDSFGNAARASSQGKQNAPSLIASSASAQHDSLIDAKENKIAASLDVEVKDCPPEDASPGKKNESEGAETEPIPSTEVRRESLVAAAANFLEPTVQNIENVEPESLLNSGLRDEPPRILDTRDAASVEPDISDTQPDVVEEFAEHLPSDTEGTLAVSSSPSEATPIASPASTSDDNTIDALEDLEPIDLGISGADRESTPVEETEELQESSTPDPTTTKLVEAISENAPVTYEHDDTDMLRNFLTRVKANKAAKAEEKAVSKRKRSLPHSPLRIPLDDAANANLSPPDKDEFDVSLPTQSPAKRQKKNGPATEEEPRSIRRSGRTRLPVKAPVAAPSFIPVRRLGQEGGDNTITVRRTEEKELAALTRVNTRKNKGGALCPVDVLAKKAEEKDDPAARQRALKEIFDEKEKKKGRRRKTVIWAEELAHYQGADGKSVVVEKQVEPEVAKETSEEKKEKKSATPRVGIRSKIALGMAANGTPAPKRKRGRS